MTGEGTNPENWAESTECYIVWTLSWGPTLENWNACVRREPDKPRPSTTMRRGREARASEAQEGAPIPRTGSTL